MNEGSRRLTSLNAFIAIDFVDDLTCHHIYMIVFLHIIDETD